MKRLERRGISGAAFVVIIVALVFMATVLLLYDVVPGAKIAASFTSSSKSSATSTPTSATSLSNSSTASTEVTSSSSEQSSTSTAAGPSFPDPSFKNGSSMISFPPDYAPLSNFTLSLINKDRAAFGLRPVSISPIQSGQQHADSMLYFGYFSHWDTQGYKPYMRYTLLKGDGGVEENVAYEYFPSHFLNSTSVEHALSGLENQMIYNDSVCCQNGHRDNILEALHDRVSLGIAYNPSYVYLVQDFENFYYNFTQPVMTGSTVRLVGSSDTALGPLVVYVFHDDYPQPLGASQLNMPPYQGGYDQGKFIGGVAPPCTLSCLTYPGNITVRAETWRVSPTSTNIVFQMNGFVQKYGRGVYTIILAEKATTTVILYSLSVFVS